MSELQKLERMLKDKKVVRVPKTPEEERKEKAQKALDILDLAKNKDVVYLKWLFRVSEQIEDLLHTEVPVSVNVEMPDMPEFPEIPKPADMTETNNLLKELINKVVSMNGELNEMKAELKKPVEVILDEED